MAFLKTYAIAFIVFFAIDLVWLGIVAKKLYNRYLGYLLSPSPNWTAAILFYLVFIAGIVFFVVNPALEKGSLVHAIVAGAFFGFVTYATYDLTNLATVKDWPVVITIIDLIWGSVLTASVSGATYWIKTLLR